jgi:CheY-like chemotaxis protein
LLSDVLRDLRSGITIHTVTSSEQAIAFLYRDAGFASAPKPHLVFLDYRMPSNGGRVLSMLKGDPDLRMIPVIAFSQGASTQDISEIYDRHANCCINKVTAAADLTQSVRTALNFWIDVAVLVAFKPGDILSLQLI